MHSDLQVLMNPRLADRPWSSFASICIDGKASQLAGRLPLCCDSDRRHAWLDPVGAFGNDFELPGPAAHQFQPVQSRMGCLWLVCSELASD